MTEQTYCDRLVQDTPFLLGRGRLSEQQVDRIILQLNRYYPQILSNKDAQKFRNPKASVRVRLCDLLGHLQRSGERDCQEFYRALYIHAQPLHGLLPSRLAPQHSDCTDLDSGAMGHELSDRGNRLLLFSLTPSPPPPAPARGCSFAPSAWAPGCLLGAPRSTSRLSPQDPWPSWPASAWLRGWRSSSTAALQTPRCCRGPGASWASRPSSWTGTSAASCWPSSRTPRGRSDSPSTREMAPPAATSFLNACFSLFILFKESYLRLTKVFDIKCWSLVTSLRNVF
uniref:caspase recruitment domain-containing protein 19 isoform X1 n=1 Tax=Nyctereutes procyonoides TaxID=34880 RepID=UPI0024452446|nr:caspase recruitment domain-containing protein 19 isoform X1 [Nyctereutes procyonoides]